MSSDTAELAAEIVRTRDDLGRTAAELATRADVRARVTAAGGTVRDRISATVRRPLPVAMITATVSAAAVAWVLIRRSRR